MRKLFLSALAVAASLAIGQGAQAGVITFDDRAPGPITNGYGGLNWSNFWVLSVPPNCCGYANAVVSAPNVAYPSYANPASFSSPGTFTLSSFDLTGAWNDGLNVSVIGRLNGVMQDSALLVVSTGGPTLESFNWTNINEVDFSSFGGTPNPAYVARGGGEHFAMDNLTISAITGVPELGTWAMMIIGFGGVGMQLRGRRRVASVA